MSVLNRKRDALEPAIVLTVVNADGSDRDCTDADSVTFNAQLTTGVTEITIEGSFTDPSVGESTFEPQAGDFDTIGIYEYDVCTTWSPGRESVDPEDSYGALVIYRRAQDA